MSFDRRRRDKPSPCIAVDPLSGADRLRPRAFHGRATVQIQTVAVGWYIYEATRDPFYLGLVGLSQFLPALLLVLATGAVADRFPRRTVMAVCLLVKALCTLAILISLRMGPDALWAVFAALFGFGTARAFFNPAQQSLLPNLVPSEQLGSAVAVNVVGLKLGVVIGPLIGGVLYAISAELAFATTVGRWRRRRPDAAHSETGARPTAEARSPEHSSPASAISGRRRSCSAPSRSICSRCYWGVSLRSSRFMLPISSTSARLASAFSWRRRRSER